MTCKTQSILYLIMVFLVIGGCSPNSPITSQAASPHVFASPTSEVFLLVTPSITPVPTLFRPPTAEYPKRMTPHVTSLPTRSPEALAEELRHLLQTNGDCKLPCFWGIYPDQTRYEELYAVIDRLDGRQKFDAIEENGHLQVGARFEFEDVDENRINIAFQADLQDDIVRDMKIHLHNPKGTEIPPEDWSAYNMNEILRIYGVPSKVELFVSSGGGVAFSFNILLNYENINTMILYSESTLGLDKYDTPTALIYCPEEIGTYHVQLHIGKHPFNTPPSGIPILQATGLNEQDFYKLFTENPSTCLTLNRDAMP
jgi:hypothetical protein